MSDFLHSKYAKRRRICGMSRAVKYITKINHCRNKDEKRERLAIRQAAELLTQTHRSVRHSDGGVGKMVGAGLHLSYHGVIEPFKAEVRSKKKRKRGGIRDAASAMALCSRSFNLFRGTLQELEPTTPRTNAIDLPGTTGELGS